MLYFCEVRYKYWVHQNNFFSYSCKCRKPWTEKGRQVNLLWDKYRQVRGLCLPVNAGNHGLIQVDRSTCCGINTDRSEDYVYL